MDNEEFQKLVLEKLDSIEKDISILKAIEEQTKGLTEFMTESKEFMKNTSKSLEDIQDDNRSIYELIGKHEISISTLKRKTS